MKLVISLLLCGIIGSLAQRTPTRRPTPYPTRYPTARPTDAYRDAYVPFLISGCPSEDVTEAQADQTDFLALVNDVTKTNLEAQSTIPTFSNAYGQEIIREVITSSPIFDATNGDIDLDVQIKLYWDYSSQIKSAVGGTDGGNFQSLMRTSIANWFQAAYNTTDGEAAGIMFSVDMTQYRETSGSNTFTIFMAVISIIVAMIV